MGWLGVDSAHLDSAQMAAKLELVKSKCLPILLYGL